MSTQKWELVTWEWLEREIVECLVIAGQRRRNRRSGSLVGLLARQPKVGPSSAMPKRKQSQEHSHA
jgi:hypothetical protein